MLSTCPWVVSDEWEQQGWERKERDLICLDRQSLNEFVISTRVPHHHLAEEKRRKSFHQARKEDPG
jgi:hypothetical protein